MRAVNVERVESPEVLVYGELSEPQPAPHDVLIRVNATWLNRLDVFMREGLHDTSIPLPQILSTGTQVLPPLYERGNEHRKISVQVLRT